MYDFLCLGLGSDFTPEAAGVCPQGAPASGSDGGQVGHRRAPPPPLEALHGSGVWRLVGGLAPSELFGNILDIFFRTPNSTSHSVVLFSLFPRLEKGGTDPFRERRRRGGGLSGHQTVAYDQLPTPPRQPRPGEGGGGKKLPAGHCPPWGHNSSSSHLVLGSFGGSPSVLPRMN